MQIFESTHKHKIMCSVAGIPRASEMLLNFIFRLSNISLALSAVTSTGLLCCLRYKNLLAMQATWVWFPGCKHPLEKGMATHSNILAWRNPQTEEPCGLHSMGSQRVGHDWVTNTPVHSRGLISIISSPIFLFSSCFVHSIKSTCLSIPNS